MEDYSVISNLGMGTYGTVYKAIHRITRQIVAIKKLKKKYNSKDECMQLRELQSLLRLKGHPNIIKLKDFFWKNDEFFFVFEYMSNNLFRHIKYKDKPYAEVEIRAWMVQILLGVDYMHKIGYFHRDLKPENLLISGEVIKIGDLGMVREMTLFGPPHTCGVTTLWYRAPEVLLQSSNYGAPIDMWAVGAIMAEFFTLRPLFRGKSEIGQLYKICDVIGAPTQHTWLQGMKMATNLPFMFHQTPPTLHNRLPNASPKAIDLIFALCSWDPNKRPTALQALQHPFFKNNAHKHCIPLPFFKYAHKHHVPLPFC